MFRDVTNNGALSSSDDLKKAVFSGSTSQSLLWGEAEGRQLFKKQMIYFHLPI